MALRDAWVVLPDHPRFRPNVFSAIEDGDGLFVIFVWKERAKSSCTVSTAKKNFFSNPETYFAKNCLAPCSAGGPAPSNKLLPRTRGAVLVSLPGPAASRGLNSSEAMATFEASEHLDGLLADSVGCAHRFMNMFLTEEYASDELSVRVKYSLCLKTTAFAAVWDIINLVVSVAAVGVFVASTHMDDGGHSLVIPVELPMTVFFTIDYFIQWLGATNYFAYPFYPLPIIDLLTIVPVYVEVAAHSSMPNTGFLRVLRIFKVFRILNMEKAHSPAMKNICGGDLDEVGIASIKLFFTLFTIIMTAAGAVFCSENALFYFIEGMNVTEYNRQGREEAVAMGDIWEDHKLWSFGNCIYFIIVTFSTVGYGDLTPHNMWSKIVIIMLIGVTVAVIPGKINDIVDLKNKMTRWRKSYSSVADFGGKHVIIAGGKGIVGLGEFITELFHPNHTGCKGDYKKPHLLIVRQEEPHASFGKLRMHPLLIGFLHYFQGSLSNDTDVIMVDAVNAYAVFVLPDPAHGAMGDLGAVFSVLILRHFNPIINMCVHQQCFQRVLASLKSLVGQRSNVADHNVTVPHISLLPLVIVLETIPPPRIRVITVLLQKCQRRISISAGPSGAHWHGIDQVLEPQSSRVGTHGICLSQAWLWDVRRESNGVLYFKCRRSRRKPLAS